MMTKVKLVMKGCGFVTSRVRSSKHSALSWNIMDWNAAKQHCAVPCIGLHWITLACANYWITLDWIALNYIGECKLLNYINCIELHCIASHVVLQKGAILKLQWSNCKCSFTDICCVNAPWIIASRPIVLHLLPDMSKAFAINEARCLQCWVFFSFLFHWFIQI